MTTSRNRVEVMHGVNFDVLERRDPEMYGGLSLPELEVKIKRAARELDLEARFFQSNSEGEFVEHLHRLPETADALLINASAWTRGQLVAKRMPLGDLSAELARYRHGWLHCDPAIAQLEVSGVFQLDDIDRALSALSDSLPVRIERFTPLWTRVVAR